MSNQQNATAVSLVSTLMIMGYYLVSIYRMIQQGGLNPDDVFQLWAIVIIATIVLNIAGNILAHIGINIAHAIKTRSDEEARILEDERDNLISLKSARVASVAGSIGVFFAMLSFVLGQPALVMFSLIIFFGLVAEIIGDLARFYFYSRGS